MKGLQKVEICSKNGTFAQKLSTAGKQDGPILFPISEKIQYF
jgi:hypothetical protein